MWPRKQCTLHNQITHITQYPKHIFEFGLWDTKLYYQLTADRILKYVFGTE